MPLQKQEERIYLRISRALEDDILSGLIRENEPVPSTNQYAEYYHINPATAAKGVSILARAGILYKKRGVGMFVSPDARERILERRRLDFREQYLLPIVEEAHKIGISKRDLIAMLMVEK